MTGAGRRCFRPWDLPRAPEVAEANVPETFVEGHIRRAVAEATACGRGGARLNQHVVRLQVAVDHASRVQEDQGGADLDHHLPQAGRRSAAPGTGTPTMVTAVAKLVLVLFLRRDDGRRWEMMGVARLGESLSVSGRRKKRSDNGWDLGGAFRVREEVQARVPQDQRDSSRRICEDIQQLGGPFAVPREVQDGNLSQGFQKNARDLSSPKRCSCAIS